MNLINDPWITVRRQSGVEGRIRPAQIAAAGETDVIVDILAPRPDFLGALYQLLIGLLQTTFAPESIDDWKERWDKPPTVDELDKVFGVCAHAFELNAKGPAFMQDFDLSTGEEKYKKDDIEPISALIIDFSGNEFFLKKERLNKLCEACSAQALLSFMLNASGSGRGHNMSSRGGGPITTIVYPLDSKGVVNPLWNKIWINVIPNDATKQDVLEKNNVNTRLAFPWMRSGKGLTARPNEGESHPCMALWSMSQRVKLLFSSDATRECDICGCQSNIVTSSLVKRPDGIDFDGLWRNQLTPYDLLADELKGKKQAVKSNVLKKGYAHWASMLLGDEKRYKSSLTVSHFYSHKYNRTSRLSANVWCFGFDMPKNQAKAACWYESRMPIYVRDEGQATLQKKVQPLLDVAEEATRLLARAVRQAWGLGKKGDPQVIQSLWQLSETRFYAVLREISQASDLEDVTLAPCYKKWVFFIGGLTLSCFDEWVLSAAIEDQDMIGIVGARELLANNLNNSKPVKALWERIDPGRVIKKRMTKATKARNTPAATAQTDLP